MQQVLSHLSENKKKHLEELTDYLAIPSISSDPDYSHEVQRCAQHTAELLTKAGMFDVKVHQTKGHPVVTGQWNNAPGKPTLLIYGHYDVQPVDPLDEWEKPPFEAHIKDELIVARGSADDKGQLFMHVKAVEAFMKTARKLPVNVKFIIEGEEEISSPSLRDFLTGNRELLKADIIVISDTAMLDADKPAISYALRGLTYLEIEVIGPNRDLHSGEYGGAVANPAEILARLLAQVKDANGRIQIPGFYDKVRELTKEERELLDRAPFDVEEYKKELGVDDLWGEKNYSPREHTWTRPTFEINGIWGGFTGVGAKTVLPARAFAKVSARLVPNQIPDEIADLIEKFFISITPKSVKIKVKRHTGGLPYAAPLDTIYVDAANRALKEAFKVEPYFVRVGGSIPIVADFKSILGIDTLLIGFCLPSCRAHSPNENMHLPSFFTGTEAIVHLMNILGN